MNARVWGVMGIVVGIGAGVAWSARADPGAPTQECAAFSVPYAFWKPGTGYQVNPVTAKMFDLNGTGVAGRQLPPGWTPVGGSFQVSAPADIGIVVACRSR